MKSLSLLLACSLLSATVRADPSAEAERFLLVPGAMQFNVAMRWNAPLAVPAALRLAIAKGDWLSTNETLPDRFEGYTRDLNGDGQPEYFIYNQHASGTGGPVYSVYTKFPDGWRCIHSFQGSLHIFPVRKNGWPCLVTISRGGPESYTKAYAEFSDGKYRETLLDQYDRGTSTQRLP